MDELMLFLRVLAAAVCGLLIGFERKSRMKEAGLRTHTIVAIGSALFTVLSLYGFKDADGARIAAQIVTGIGFLGAGMIIFRRDSLHGLTTAAGIWTTAGIGMAMGTGMYILGSITTVAIIFFQLMLHSRLKIFVMKKSNTLLIECDADKDSIKKIEYLFNVTKVIKTKMIKNENNVTMLLTIKTFKEFNAEKLLEYIKDNPFIKRIENDEELNIQI